MKTGKLESSVLDRILKKYTGYKREDVLKSGAIGEDCSFVDLGRKTLVLTNDPVTAASEEVGTIGFNINMNDISASGAEGIGLMVTLLLPPTAELSDIERVMGELHDEALKYRIQILGGHTEVTDAVNRIILSVTAVGLTERGSEISASGARKGDTFVVSKNLGTEGTLIIAGDFKDRLEGVLTESEIKEALNLKSDLSVINEGRIGRKVKVHAMHDITEGGVSGALWEVSKASGTGCLIKKELLPFSEITLKACEKLKIDPLRLISSGSMLFATDRPEELIKELEKAGIKGTAIGKATEEGFRIEEKGIISEIDPPKRDEIYGLFE